MNPNKRRMLYWVALLGWFSFMFAGCGPIQSISNIMRASAAIEAAHSIEGWKYGCHEYYAALRFLYKARIEAGYSDFEAAAEYAELAAKYAEKARARAQMHRTRGSQAVHAKHGAKFVDEGKGHIRVICQKPPDMKMLYSLKKKP